MSILPPTNGESAIRTLGHKIFLAGLKGDQRTVDAVNSIVAWAKQRGGSDYPPSASEPLIRYFSKAKGWTPDHTAQQNIEDLAALIDHDPEATQYPDHWTSEDIAIWEGGRKEREYRWKGTELLIRHHVEQYKQEWESRVGTTFPGISRLGNRARAVRNGPPLP